MGGNWAPLAGTRVLDFGWVVSGPLVGAFLAALGAEVIKVESRARSDNMRLRNAMVDGRIDWDRANNVPTFHALNRGKRSIAVDVKQPDGLEVVKGLVRRSHALVENYTVGALARMGLDDAELERLNPGLVHVALSPAGRTGRLVPLRGYAATTGSLAGLEGAVGYDAKAPTGMLTFGLADYAAGAHAAFAVVAALRQPDGPKFVSIDASQLEANVVALGAGFAALDAGLDTVPANRHALHVPHGVFPAQDGRFVALAVYTDDAWSAVVDVLQLSPDLRVDRDRRVARRDEIERAVADALMQHPCDEAVDMLRAAGVDAAPVLRMEERYADPYFSARAADTTVSMRDGRDVVVPATPWRVDGVRAGPIGRDRAPDLGEDTEWACVELLGMPEDRFRDLCERGIVG